MSQTQCNAEHLSNHKPIVMQNINLTFQKILRTNITTTDPCILFITLFLLEGSIEENECWLFVELYQHYFFWTFCLIVHRVLESVTKSTLTSIFYTLWLCVLHKWFMNTNIQTIPCSWFFFFLIVWSCGINEKFLTTPNPISSKIDPDSSSRRLWL